MLIGIVVVQFLELAFHVYQGWYTYAATLAFISIAASCLSVRVLYQKRLELYKNIQHRRVVPLVTAGRVRSALTLLRVCEPDAVHMLLSRAACA